MLTAIIVDDEAPAIELLRRRIDQAGDVKVLASFQDSQAALAAIIELRPDAVFLDIDMPGITGLELAAQLVEAGVDSAVVFVSAYNEYALEAFRVNALHYLLKPASLAEVQETIARLQKRLPAAAVPSEQASPAQGRICCFGGFKIYTDSKRRDYIKWRTAKAEELFAFLFEHRGNSVPKWELCDALWPDLDENKVDTHLHTTVYQVRKALRKSGLDIELKSSSGSYTLAIPPHVASDVAEFDALLTKAEPGLAECEQALQLYQHDYLNGKYYIWSLAQQERYRNQFIGCAKRLADNYWQSGKVEQALSALKKVLEISPLEEAAHEMLLKIHFLHRQRVPFIEHYNAMALLFEQELDIQPHARLRAWYEEITAKA